ncbi:MAG TPA: hypothetical protein VK620_37280 [Bradyrhizobium sp.]|nr:hypothetical protein [Bradyrhizobium sp.]
MDRSSNRVHRSDKSDFLNMVAGELNYPFPVSRIFTPHPIVAITPAISIKKILVDQVAEKHNGRR